MTQLIVFQYAPSNGTKSDEIRILWCVIVCELWDLPLTRITINLCLWGENVVCHCLWFLRSAANAETKGHKYIRTKELQDIRAWTCVHVPSRTEGLRRYDFERHKQRNYSIKRYGVALMSLEATRTIVRGRQPRCGLVCLLCKLRWEFPITCPRDKKGTAAKHKSSPLQFPILANVANIPYICGKTGSNA